VTQAKGKATAEIARGFFGLQLHYADVLTAKSGISLADAITFHTNFHRLFAYGNLGRIRPDPDFLALVQTVVARDDADARLDLLIDAYGDRPADPWPSDRFAFGNHFACEAPTEGGIVRIHFRNRFNNDAHGPLHSSNISQRRADLTAMFGFVASRWPDTKAVNGASWLYNLEAYRRLFPPDYGASRTPLHGPRPIHGLSTWGQFLDFKGRAKAAIVAQFKENLTALDAAQPWLAFPHQVLAASAPFDSFRRAYRV
jgi:hypothetical protein